jgi:tetratricopeptide (TPR) repeat protein
MKLLIMSLITASVFIAGSANIYEQPSPATSDSQIATCGMPAGDAIAGTDGKFIRALTGWGKLHYPISSRNDSTRFYFDQGLNLYYGYHFPEAVASFREAARLDPSCAMAYWGQALARGPFYNNYYYQMPKDVPGIVDEMKKHSSGSTKKEKDLIEALAKRYSNDLSNADRKDLDENYAAALMALTKTYADDNNIKALYIDAVMLQHKWDFWVDGKPRPWTNELVSMCEDVLKKEQHPAVLHYYIHLTEASREAGRALAAADRLKDQLPGIGHMVHMSSHMYQRNGLYAKGVKVNDDANDANNEISRLAPGIGYGKDKSIHYYAVQSYCAMTAGMYSKGLRIYQRARERQVAMNPDFAKEPYSQFVYMMPTIALARLGKWDEILASEKPDDTWKYAQVLDNFARGMAFIAKKDLASAGKSLAALNEAMKDDGLKVRFMPFNTPLQSCTIASHILSGRLLFENGKHDEAIAALRRAVEEEDNMVYREPQDWLIPARQFLGMYLMKMDQAAEAEKVYRQDLIENPGNGWSLTGLHQSLKAQGKTEARSVEAQAKKAREDADVLITASVF